MTFVRILKKIVKRRYKIIQTNWIKTIWFNLTKLPFNQGIKIPVLWANHCIISIPRGGVFLGVSPRFGMVSLGYRDLPTQDRRNNRMVIVVQEEGCIRFDGPASIGGGTKILVRKNSEIVFGNNFYLSLESTIYCYNRIVFGNDCTVGWNVLIMDTDWHKTFDALSGEDYSMTQPIFIGNHCWICNDVQIQKGTIIPDNVIVGAKSLCNKKYDVPGNSLIAGIPAKIKKENIGYDR